MFLALSLKELRLHKALNALSMNWEKFAVRISRQFLKKTSWILSSLAGRPAWLYDPRGEQHRRVPTLVGSEMPYWYFSDSPGVQVSVLRLPIKSVLLLGNLPTKHTHTRVHTHVCTHARTPCGKTLVSCLESQRVALTR